MKDKAEIIKQENDIIMHKFYLDVLEELLQHWKDFKQNTCDSCIPDRQVDAMEFAIKSVKTYIDCEEANQLANKYIYYFGKDKHDL